MAYRRALQPRKGETPNWEVTLNERQNDQSTLDSVLAKTRHVLGGWEGSLMNVIAVLCGARSIHMHASIHNQYTPTASEKGRLTVKVRLQADNEDINMTNDNSQRQNSPCPIAHHINLLNTPINNSKPKAWPTGQWAERQPTTDNRQAKPKKPKAQNLNRTPATWPRVKKSPMDTQPYRIEAKCRVNYDALFHTGPRSILFGWSGHWTWGHLRKQFVVHQMRTIL